MIYIWNGDGGGVHMRLDESSYILSNWNQESKAFFNIRMPFFVYLNNKLFVFTALVAFY